MESTNNDNAPISPGDAKRRQEVQTREAVRRALADVESERQAPRLRAKAKADHAAQVTVEALGVYDKLPEHDIFQRFINTRAKLAEAVQATFTQMSSALNSSHLDGPQAVVRIADLGRTALNQHIGTINETRSWMREMAENVQDRKNKAMTPPLHLAGIIPSARDAIRAMSEKDRENLFRIHQADDDTDVIWYAVGGAPAFVTGVSEGKRKEMELWLLGLRDPALVQLIPGVKRALESLNKMEDAIRRLISDVADFDAADSIRALQAGSKKG